MRVITPQLKLDVRIDAINPAGGQLQLTGMAGMLPCEMTIGPAEIRKLLRLALKPATLRLLLTKEVK